MTYAAPLAHAHHSKLSVNENALVECVGVCFNCAQACITDADLHRARWRVVVVVAICHACRHSCRARSRAGASRPPAARRPTSFYELHDELARLKRVTKPLPQIVTIALPIPPNPSH